MMMAMNRIAAAAVLVLGMAIFQSFLPANQPAANPAPAAGGFQPLGGVGCSAAACHGRLDANAFTKPPDTDCWKTSATIFHAVDPHRKAYQTLLAPESKRIAERLGTGIPAHEDARCLACHSNPTLAHGDLSTELTALRGQGVSCEACHGNAERWQADHVAWSDWNLRKSNAAALGFVDLNSSDERAMVCARCHIGHGALPGTPAFDMNHDMIAAGHPRLDFDYASLLNRLPKHWQERDREPNVAPESPQQILDRHWRSGERAAVLARLSLLESRADRATDGDKRTQWPEFAEFSCESCHRAITPDRPSPFAAQFPSGTVNWSMPLDSRLQPLHELMNSRTGAAAADAARRVREVRDKLNGAGDGTFPTFGDRLRQIAGMTDEALRDLTWEDAAMAYRALAAADFLRGSAEAAATNGDDDFTMLKAMLLAPSEYDAEKAAAAIRRLVRQLHRDGEPAPKLR